jgi:hypothetical protein
MLKRSWGDLLHVPQSKPAKYRTSSSWSYFHERRESSLFIAAVGDHSVTLFGRPPAKQEYRKCRARPCSSRSPSFCAPPSATSSRHGRRQANDRCDQQCSLSLFDYFPFIYVIVALIWCTDLRGIPRSTRVRPRRVGGGSRARHGVAPWTPRIGSW